MILSNKKNRRVAIKMMAAIICLSVVSGCGGNQQSESSTNGEDTSKKAVTVEKKVVEITVKAMGTNMQDMQYDLDKIKVPANSRVKITLVNAFSSKDSTAMSHNIVFVSFGKAEEVALAGAKAGKEKNYLPDSPEIIAASRLSAPGETVTIEFDAPPSGIYDFVCTFPGHYQRMNGTFVVEESGL